ncbi:MAG: hypothetical protein EAZ24_16605 [Burkholderiales bacterium]|nr:MAG: hypothetical protein EAZ24_16605 [Burkholderiales bacterium]
MLDPGRGVYFEFPAPDLRLSALLMLMVVVLVSKRWSALTRAAKWMIVGFLVTLWSWSYISGNGRYFLPGLVLVGPLAIALAIAIKVTTAMRWAVVGFVLIGQFSVVTAMYVPNPLTNLKWTTGNVVGLPESFLRNEPAVFTVIGGNSHSALVPSFHPESRWIALLGNYTPPVGSSEQKRVQEALASSLKKYVIADGALEPLEKRAEAHLQLRSWLNTRLRPLGLGLSEEPCHFLARAELQTSRQPTPINLETPGRWICRFETARLSIVNEKTYEVPKVHRAAFDTIEAMCPRFFPPGGGQDHRGDGVSFRVYPGSDTQLRARDNGVIVYRYQQALNPTLIGPVEKVAAGDATMNCKKLDGRYQLPWNR